MENSEKIKELEKNFYNAMEELYKAYSVDKEVDENKCDEIYNRMVEISENSERIIMKTLSEQDKKLSEEMTKLSNKKEIEYLSNKILNGKCEPLIMFMIIFNEGR